MGRILPPALITVERGVDLISDRRFLSPSYRHLLRYRWTNHQIGDEIEPRLYKRRWQELRCGHSQVKCQYYRPILLPWAPKFRSSLPILFDGATIYLVRGAAIVVAGVLGVARITILCSIVRTTRVGTMVRLSTTTSVVEKTRIWHATRIKTPIVVVGAVSSAGATNGVAVRGFPTSRAIVTYEHCFFIVALALRLGANTNLL